MFLRLCRQKNFSFTKSSFIQTRKFHSRSILSEAGKLTFTFATPNETIIKEKIVYSVLVPTDTGTFGILADHVPTVAQLKPGIVTVFGTSLENITHKYFISGGFAIVNADSTASISAVEAVKIEDLDANAAKKGLESSTAAFAKATSEKDKAEAQIGMEVYEAVLAAAEGRA